MGFAAEDICKLRIGDCAAMLALNDAYVKETSALDEDGLVELPGMAFYARGIGGGATALLIAGFAGLGAGTAQA
jgi:predicted GNAT superfamily acetyltransferase